MRVLVALGGNAILRHKESGTAEEQIHNVRQVCHLLARLIQSGTMLRSPTGTGRRWEISSSKMRWRRRPSLPCLSTSVGRRARG